jgi:succinoglycan biosynthesis transport protein ExoP
MGIHHALAVLRARFFPMIAVILATIGATILVCLILPARYTAYVTLVVDSVNKDPVTGFAMPANVGNDYLETQKEVIQSQAVAIRVVKDLKLADDPDTKDFWLKNTEGRGSIESWLAGGLLRNLKAELGKQSSIITLSYTDRDAEQSAKLANAFAQAYVDTNLELRVSPARQASAWFTGQISHLKENLERAQNKLSEYQRSKGIISTDEKVDVENNRLNDLSAQLAIAQSQSIEAVSRKRQLDQYVKEGRSPEALPDAIGNALINGLKQQLVTAEGKLNQLAGQLGKNHPEYQKSAAEVDQIKRQLSVELETMASGIANSARIAQAKESDLRSAVAAQKARVLELNKEKGRDDLSVLMREVETAQKAYEAASQRSSEVNLESRISQTNVAVLSPATEPLKPSFPDWGMNLALSFVLGSMLGVAFAFMMEQADRRIRTREDVAQIPGLAVLGVLGNTSRTMQKTFTEKFNPLAILQRSQAS